MSDLVLSLFPGLGMLDHAFTLEGCCVVRGPEWIFGADVREFHPPSGVFDGIIGGDPCQSHSALSNLVRAKGLEPSFPDLTPEFVRIVEEARPGWFLRENVPNAPDMKPTGYDVRSFLLDLSTLDSGDGTGHEQMRRRRFWFGVRDAECPDIRRWIRFAFTILPELESTIAWNSLDLARFPGRRSREARQQTVSADARQVPIAIGGSGVRKRQATVKGRHDGSVGAPGIDYSPPRRSLSEMLRLQGFPEDWCDRQPWTAEAKRKMVGNGVALPMGRALAHAIQCWQAEMAARSEESTRPLRPTEVAP